MINFNIDKITHLTPNFGPFQKEMSPVKEGVVTFGEVLKSAIRKADDVIMRAGEVGRKVATGQVKSIQEVTLTWAETGLVIKMAKFITSKIIEGARTLFQVQV